MQFRQGLSQAIAAYSFFAPNSRRAFIYLFIYYYYFFFDGGGGGAPGSSRACLCVAV